MPQQLFAVLCEHAHQVGRTAIDIGALDQRLLLLDDITFS